MEKVPVKVWFSAIFSFWFKVAFIDKICFLFKKNDIKLRSFGSITISKDFK